MDMPVDVENYDDETDPLEGARGVYHASLLAVPVWIVTLLVVWLLLR